MQKNHILYGMDRRDRYLNRALLKQIAKKIDDESYSFLTYDDLSEGLLPEWEISAESVLKHVQQIARAGYVDLKYADPANYCLKWTKEGRTLCEREAEWAYMLAEAKRSVFFAALIGSVVSGGIVALVVGLCI